ncbi:MAG: helix-turn-helix transcriptional regulator, partial [Polyangiaceae bacterium]
EDHPHVYWSIPKNWFPGSVAFKEDEVPELLRQLRRIPHGQGRARLLSLVLDRLPVTAPELTAAPAVVVARDSTPDEERHLSVVEDSANRRIALHMRYFTRSRLDEGTRDASVHRVLLGPPARFVATCHRDGKLKTFRVDGILDARLALGEPYRPADETTVEQYIQASLSGFHNDGQAMELSFLVRNPEARWVKTNLLDGMRADTSGDGIRVTIRTSALRQLARYVVGLGEAATPESADLAREVAALATGALQAIARTQ